MSACVHDGCTEPLHAREVCKRHYNALRYRETHTPRPRKRRSDALSLDGVTDLLEVGERPQAIADRFGVRYPSLLKAAATRPGLLEWLTTGESMRPARSAHEKGRGSDRVHLNLVAHPDYEKRLCAGDWHQWDGPADGETAASWWEYRGKDASLACMRCPVLEQCAEWRRSGAVVTGVLAGVPLDEGRPVDVTSRRKRGNGEVAA